MEKYIYDESNGLWCQRHLRYIREYRKALYTSLKLSGKPKLRTQSLPVT